MQNIRKETMNNRVEKQKLTKLDKFPENETISDASSCNFTIDKEEVEEVFTEKNCSGTAENTKVIEQEIENANKTSISLQSDEYNESYLNTDKLKPLELHNSAVLKQ